MATRRKGDNGRSQFLKEAESRGLTGRVKTTWVSAQVAQGRLMAAREDAREAARKKAELKAAKRAKAQNTRKKTAR